MTVKRFRVRFALLSLLVVITMGPAQARTFYHEKPNTIAFEAHEAAFVRVLIHATQDNAQPCVDEFEVYGPEGKNLADAATGAVASASASLEGYAIHKVEHLNDGAYGNSQSWIGGAAGGVWLQIAPASAHAGGFGGLFPRPRGALQGSYANRCRGADLPGWRAVYFGGA